MIPPISDGLFRACGRAARSRVGWLPVCLAASTLGAEEPLVLDRIEVKGTRTEQAPFSAPVTVTAFDGGFIESQGITDFEELARFVPGLFVSVQAPDDVSLNLRGLTSDSSDPRVPPRVSVFQDGVALGNAHGNGVALFDLEEIAVFKGPQPTRFGEGVESGALVLTSRSASRETSGSFTAGVGSFGARNVDAYVNSPLVGGKLFGRVALYVNERDGYVKNLADGSNLQGEDTVAVRMSLRWQPTTRTTADLIFSHQADDAPGVAFKSAVFPAEPGPSGTDPYTDANLTRGDELGVERTITGLTGVVNHELSDAWTLTSTSAWREVGSHNEFDADGSSLYLLELGEVFEGQQLSQELRFAYDAGGPFTAASGLNVAWAKDEQTTTIRTDENVLWKFLTQADPPYAMNTRYAERNTNEAEATTGEVFGRSDYRITERLTLGIGLRLTQERLSSRFQSFAAATPSSFPFPLLPTADTTNTIFKVSNGLRENVDAVRSWAGELDVRYAFSPRLTTYAAITRGRRSPILDFNDVTLAPQVHAEETVVNYEVGVKGASAGERVRYDVSVFQYDFDHFQTQRIISVGVKEPFDGGRASGRGVETTVRADVARELAVFAAYGFTDATFAGRSEDGQAQAYAGNTFRLTSRHVISLGGTVSLPVSAGGVLFVTPSYTYRSAYFFQDDNALNGGILRQRGFGLANLRGGYRAQSQAWEVVGYVNNLLDQQSLLDAGNTGGAYGLPTRIAAAPRMAGVQATVRF